MRSVGERGMNAAVDRSLASRNPPRRAAARSRRIVDEDRRPRAAARSRRQGAPRPRGARRAPRARDGGSPQRSARLKRPRADRKPSLRAGRPGNPRDATGRRRRQLLREPAGCAPGRGRTRSTRRRSSGTALRSEIGASALRVLPRQAESRGVLGSARACQIGPCVEKDVEALRSNVDAPVPRDDRAATVDPERASCRRLLFGLPQVDVDRVRNAADLRLGQAVALVHTRCFGVRRDDDSVTGSKRQGRRRSCNGPTCASPPWKVANVGTPSNFPSSTHVSKRGCSYSWHSSTSQPSRFSARATATSGVVR